MTFMRNFHLLGGTHSVSVALWLMYLNSWSPASGTVCGGCGIFGHGASLADRDIRVEVECSRLHFG